MAEARYELKTTCGTKEEIPIGNNQGANPMEQQRVPMQLPPEMLNKVKPASRCPTCYGASSVPNNLPHLFCAAKKGKRIVFNLKQGIYKVLKSLKFENWFLRP